MAQENLLNIGFAQATGKTTTTQINQQSQDGVRSMEVVGVPIIHSLWDQTPPLCDSWNTKSTHVFCQKWIIPRIASSGNTRTPLWCSNGFKESPTTSGPQFPVKKSSCSHTLHRLRRTSSEGMTGPSWHPPQSHLRWS